MLSFCLLPLFPAFRKIIASFIAKIIPLIGRLFHAFRSGKGMKAALRQNKKNPLR
ncbi:hypothetical protein HMPREF1986_01100 [Oribacterium sp. oral taxon 078 str. F0263]|nr:hypothetical protein HMPREF1986_01100 [Oribacterium sp. oral taxon 078 str. F0263]